mgnify:CR=1 FL=1
MRSQLIRDLCARAVGEIPAVPEQVEETKTASADSLIEDIDTALESSGQAETRSGKIALAKLMAAGDILMRGGVHADREDRV